MKQILKAIERDGMVECDIHVPLQWMKKNPKYNTFTF